MTRVDALGKAQGESLFASDVDLPGLVHAAVARSELPHALIRRVDASDAAGSPGVIGVFTGKDVTRSTFGRGVRDMTILADDRVRHIGEAIAAVVAGTREEAEAAVRLIVVDYQAVPAILDASSAVAPNAPLVHEAPWLFPKAGVREGDGPNLQSRIHRGDLTQVESALNASHTSIDRTYKTASGHPGYIEPQSSTAHFDEEGILHIWATNKVPYPLRDELANCLGLERNRVVVHPVAIGGDFGGKGAFGEIPLCAELARLTKRPVRLAIRYWEDLISRAPRHSASIRVRVGCDASGALTALAVDALFDGGAYAGAKPRPAADLGGPLHAGSSYRIPQTWISSRIAYTNTVPRGHMRSPGSPQTNFAVESALDELAEKAGIDPVDLRRRNLLTTGDSNPAGERWIEARGVETLEAALRSVPTTAAPPGWLRALGVAVFDHHTPPASPTSIRLVEADGRFIVEVPIVETGTGNHSVIREAVARALKTSPEKVAVSHVPTSDLLGDRGVGGSRVTITMSEAVAELASAWTARGDSTSVQVDTTGGGGVHDDHVTSFCVQVADVAVDPDTGEIAVLGITTAIDVASVLSPKAHAVQVEGGTVMGYGFARLEDLNLQGGQIWASNLGEFKIPSIQDAPPMTTVLVPGGRGSGRLDVKAVGELSNVPTAAAIANAIAIATGVRLRSLPLKSEAVWAAKHAPSPSEKSSTFERPLGD